MTYAPAHIITQGYKYERASSPARALVYRNWLAHATSQDRENRLEIVRLFELGRAEAR